MTLNHSDCRYVQTLRVERGKLSHPDDLRKFDEKQVEELKNWHCAERNGNTPESELCDVPVERNSEDKMLIPAACKECRNAVYEGFHFRWGAVVQLGNKE